MIAERRASVAIEEGRTLSRRTRVLFVCGRNRRRSPTAEHVFADHPRLDCASAGTSHGADVPVSVELVTWADLIVVMEREHRRKLQRDFGPHLADTRIVCLDVPDRYAYLDPDLVTLLERRMARFIPDA